jgi:hypothetical protein
LSKYPDQLLFAPLIHHIGSAHTFSLAHAHIQRTILDEAKSALRMIHLRTTDPQIHQNPIATPWLDPMGGLSKTHLPNL